MASHNPNTKLGTDANLEAVLVGLADAELAEQIRRARQAELDALERLAAATTREAA